MKGHAVLVIFLAGIFLGGGFLDRGLMSRGRRPLLSWGPEFYRDGNTIKYRSLTYEAKMATELAFWEDDDPDGIEVSQVETISITWQWRWLNLVIWILMGFPLHKLLKRIPKGTVA